LRKKIIKKKNVFPEKKSDHQRPHLLQFFFNKKNNSFIHTIQ
jgi:hypothetical protein